MKSVDDRRSSLHTPFTLFPYAVHTHRPYTSSTHTVHTLFSHTPFAHHSHTVLAHTVRTPFTNTVHTLFSHTSFAHRSHAPPTNTVHTHRSHTPSTHRSHTPFTHTGHTLFPHTPSTNTVHTHTPSTYPVHTLQALKIGDVVISLQRKPVRDACDCVRLEQSQQEGQRLCSIARFTQVPCMGRLFILGKTRCTLRSPSLTTFPVLFRPHVCYIAIYYAPAIECTASGAGCDTSRGLAPGSGIRAQCEAWGE